MAKQLPATYITPTGNAAYHDALDRLIKGHDEGTYTAGTTPTLATVDTFLTNLVTYANAARLLADDAKSNYPDV